MNDTTCARCNRPATDARHQRGTGWTHDALVRRADPMTRQLDRPTDSCPKLTGLSTGTNGVGAHVVRPTTAVKARCVYCSRTIDLTGARA